MPDPLPSDHEHDLPPEVEEWLAARDQHIAFLEQALAEARQSLGAVTADLEKTRQAHVTYVGAYQQRTGELQNELHQLQSDYERLRVQKGGFGIKAMVASGSLAFLVGLAFFRLFLVQKDPANAVFEQFRKAAGFQVEYAVSQRQFEQAEKIITDHAGTQTYAPVKGQLDFIQGVISAARRACDTLDPSVVTGFSVKKPKPDADISVEPARQLKITENGALVLVEADPNATPVVALNKNEIVGQWDRTPETHKHKITHKGEKGTATDYWYEVETTDGHKGWVFGFYTNASLRRFKSDIPDSLKTKQDTLNF